MTEEQINTKKLELAQYFHCNTYEDFLNYWRSESTPRYIPVRFWKEYLDWLEVVPNFGKDRDYDRRHLLVNSGYQVKNSDPLKPVSATPTYVSLLNIRYQVQIEVFKRLKGQIEARCEYEKWDYRDVIMFLNDNILDWDFEYLLLGKLEFKFNKKKVVLEKQEVTEKGEKWIFEQYFYGGMKAMPFDKVVFSTLPEGTRVSIL